MMGHEHAGTAHSPETPLEYAKFAGVIASIFVVSLIFSWLRDWTVGGFMVNFMAVFFLVFASFKLANLSMFAATYRGYDIAAKRFPVWAYAYPFIQLGLGLGYLLLGDKDWLHLTTLILSLLASIGVARELTRKVAIPCACLGNVIKLPLSKISLVEDGTMLFMAMLMLNS